MKKINRDNRINGMKSKILNPIFIPVYPVVPVNFSFKITDLEEHKADPPNRSACRAGFRIGLLPFRGCRF